MKKTALFVVLFALQSWPSQEALAGPYSDTLAKCLVSSTTTEDRSSLVRWMFTAASLHPAVKPISNVSDEQLDEANRIIANLVTDLLTESCREETEQALQYEGTTTIQTSFMVLGQVAGQELFASPEVAAGLSGLEKHIDEEKLGSLKGLQ